MKKSILYILAIVVLSACTDSEATRQRIDRQQRLEQRRQDSLALKIAVVPTLDGLPLFLAHEHRMFDTLGVDVRLRRYNAQMDCDTAFRGGTVEGIVSDIVRTERFQQQGLRLKYVASTGEHWQLVASKRSRVSRLNQLGDKVVGITRFSATDWLTNQCLESEKVKDNVYRVQINDVLIRLRMLLGNEIDAAWLSEPWATLARQRGGVVLIDSSDRFSALGVIAFNVEAIRDKRRQKQLSLFLKGYNMACDSLNAHGLSAYADVLKKYYRIDTKTIMALPKKHYKYATEPNSDNINKVASFVSTTIKPSY